MVNWIFLILGILNVVCGSILKLSNEIKFSLEDSNVARPVTLENFNKPYLILESFNVQIWAGTLEKINEIGLTLEMINEKDFS